MKTIHIYYLFIPLVLLTNIAFSQRFIQPEKKLYDIKADMTIYFDSLRLVTPDSVFNGEGSEFIEYQRWLGFWEPRLFPHGDFTYYFTAMKNFYKNNHTGSPVQSANVDPWYEIGPHQKPMDALPVGSRTRCDGMGPIEFITFYDSDPNYMLCGSNLGGLFYSINGGQSWQKSGTDAKFERSGCGSAVFHPDNNHIWFASSSGQSGSGGSSFIQYTGGIYRTTDEGINWTKIADYNTIGSIWNIVYKLLIDPVDPNTLYAATAGGLYVTYNCNSPIPIWINLSESSVPNSNVYDLEMHPTNHQILYASFSDAVQGGYKNSRVMYTNDGGQTWNVLPNHPAISAGINSRLTTIEVSKANPSNLYVQIGNTGGNSTLYKYDFSNQTWQIISTARIQFGGGHAFGVNQFNSNEVYAQAGSGSAELKKIIIGGSSTIIPSYYSRGNYHMDIEDIVCHPANANEVWMANHGGVYQSLDNGLTWQDRSDGLNVVIVFKMATSYSSPDYALISSDHDGTMLTNAPYQNNWLPPWRTVVYGEWGRPLIDNTDTRYMWGSSYFGLWSSSDNTGATFNFLAMNEFVGSDDFFTEGVLNKVTPSIIYFVSTHYADPGDPGDLTLDYIYRSFDRGITYNSITPDFSTIIPNTSKFDIIKAFTPFTNGNHLVIEVFITKTNGNEEVHLFRTTIANAPASDVISSWEELPLPVNSFPTDIAFDWEDPNIIYIANSTSFPFYENHQYGNNMIFKMNYTDPSSMLPYTCASGTCEDLTKNLPNVSVGMGDMIELEKGSDGGLYVGTDVGIYYTNNKLLKNNSGWQKFGTDLPNVTVGGMEINYKINKLRIGLYGRGMWEHDLYCPADFDLTESGTYTADKFLEAENNITSTAIVSNGINITYRAGNRITLSPGFKASAGSKFHAFIHPCDRPGNSFKRGITAQEGNENSGKDKAGMLQYNYNKDIKIVPNPTTGVFLLTNINKASNIYVYDLLGNVVLQKISTAQTNLTIDISNRARGIYYVKVISQKGELLAIKKVVVQ